MISRIKKFFNKFQSKAWEVKILPVTMGITEVGRWSWRMYYLKNPTVRISHGVLFKTEKEALAQDLNFNVTVVY